jgi:hypothetical protein
MSHFVLDGSETVGIGRDGGGVFKLSARPTRLARCGITFGRRASTSATSVATKKAFVSRLISLFLTFAIVGCAQRATPFAPNGSPPMTSSAGAIAVKPADSVTAYVTFKNVTGHFTVVTVYWSYAANPFWHVEVEKCLQGEAEFHTKVVYNHVKEGPQIRFRAVSTFDAHPRCGPKLATERTITFRAMNFDPDAHFHVDYFKAAKEHILCAGGGGNKEICHSQ